MGKKSNNKSPSDEAYKSEGRHAKNKERKRLKEENKKAKKCRQIERRKLRIEDKSSHENHPILVDLDFSEEVSDG